MENDSSPLEAGKKHAGQDIFRAFYLNPAKPYYGALFHPQYKYIFTVA